MAELPETLHATAIAIEGQGVLLLGPSGSGKSDLSLRLIDRGAKLVADDRVIVSAALGGLKLSAPPNIAGKMEVRGLGVLELPESLVSEATLARLAVDLSAAPERLPEPEYFEHLGVALPLIRLSAFEASAPIKLEWALALQLGGG